MQSITLLTLALAYCHALHLPHSEYGVPKELLKTADVSTKYEAPLNSYGVPVLQEKYGVPTPAPVISEYHYAIPTTTHAPTIHHEYGVPHEEYAVPRHIQEEYGVPAKPHDEYGVPLVKAVAPVVTTYEYAIPRFVPVAPVIHEKYGVPDAPHHEYGVPQIHEEYGVPKAVVAPVETTYAYTIPKIEAPVLTPKIHEEYGVPQIHEEYGVPKTVVAPVESTYAYTIPKIEAPVQPLTPKINEEYGVPHKPHNEYGTPLEPHHEYGVPQPKEYVIEQAVKPVEIQYEYGIPHSKPLAPVPEYGVPTPEYGVPKVAAPVPEYGVPTIPEAVPVEVPHSVYGVPTV